MLMITGTDKKQSKIIVNTNQVTIRYFIQLLIIAPDTFSFHQAFQMSNLIREYMEKIAEGQERGQIMPANGGEVSMVYGSEWRNKQKVQLTFLRRVEKKAKAKKETVF